MTVDLGCAIYKWQR